MLLASSLLLGRLLARKRCGNQIKESIRRFFFNALTGCLNHPLIENTCGVVEQVKEIFKDRALANSRQVGVAHSPILKLASADSKVA